MTTPCLTLVPSVPVWSDGDAVLFDRKFYDGLMQYLASWPGPVRCVAWQAAGEGPAFGSVRARVHDLPFQLLLLAPTERLSASHLAGATIVLAAADDHRQLHVAALCRAAHIRCVYVIEYIHETRLQINRLEAPNAWLRARRRLFLWRCERMRRRAFAACHGLQANGVPAFDAYRAHANTLLYFDTRMERQAFIAQAQLTQRLAGLANKRPLRLAFSGRLIAMKGADHLVQVAAGLKARSVDCRWTLFGSGDLEPAIRDAIRQQGLDDCVTLAGAVDFDSELVPTIQAEVDLYVMLHRQSDPSCTYLETLACGIPIVGYDNRALAGLLKLATVGQAVPLNDTAAAVDVIARLDAYRHTLARWSRAAIDFAQQHSFEDTFHRRIEHLLAICKEAP
jgi:colanic acid/amylovoran biosynthesis glycosyltransferase